VHGGALRNFTSLKVENQVFRLFHVVNLPNEGRGQAEVLISVAWKADYNFPNNCPLKLFRFLERFLDKSTKRVFVGGVTSGLNK